MDPAIPPAAPPATPPASPPSENWLSSIVDPAQPGGFITGWQDKLPDDLKDFRGYAADSKGMADLLKRGLTSMQAAREKSGLKPLPADATDEQKAAWDAEYRTTVGVPERADGYGIEFPKTEGVEWDAPGYLGEAHKLGLSKEQAEGLMKWYTGRYTEGRNAELAQAIEDKKADTAELEKTHGRQLPASVDLVKRATHEAGWPAEVFDPANPDFIGHKPFNLIHLLASKLAKATGGDPFPGAARVANDPHGLVWAEEVMSGKHADSADWKKGNPGIVARVNAAYKAAYPGEK